MSELSKVHVVSPLTAHVNGLYEETTRWLEGALQSLCSEFKPDKVSKVGHATLTELHSHRAECMAWQPPLPPACTCQTCIHHTSINAPPQPSIQLAASEADQKGAPAKQV